MYIVISSLRKFQWNLKRNSYILFEENVFENVVCEMAVILSRPQYDKTNHIKSRIFGIFPRLYRNYMAFVTNNTR